MASIVSTMITTSDIFPLVVSQVTRFDNWVPELDKLSIVCQASRNTVHAFIDRLPSKDRVSYKMWKRPNYFTSESKHCDKRQDDAIEPFRDELVSCIHDLALNRKGIKEFVIPNFKVSIHDVPLQVPGLPVSKDDFVFLTERFTDTISEINDIILADIIPFRYTLIASHIKYPEIVFLVRLTVNCPLLDNQTTVVFKIEFCLGPENNTAPVENMVLKTRFVPCDLDCL
jgi:hypothetical protein